MVDYIFNIPRDGAMFTDIKVSGYINSIEFYYQDFCHWRLDNIHEETITDIPFWINTALIGDNSIYFKINGDGINLGGKSVVFDEFRLQCKLNSLYAKNRDPPIIYKKDIYHMLEPVNTVENESRLY